MRCSTANGVNLETLRHPELYDVHILNTERASADGEAWKGEFPDAMTQPFCVVGTADEGSRPRRLVVDSHDDSASPRVRETCGGFGKVSCARVEMRLGTLEIEI